MVRGCHSCPAIPDCSQSKQRRDGLCDPAVPSAGTQREALPARPLELVCQLRAGMQKSRDFSPPCSARNFLNFKPNHRSLECRKSTPAWNIIMMDSPAISREQPRCHRRGVIYIPGKLSLPAGIASGAIWPPGKPLLRGPGGDFLPGSFPGNAAGLANCLAPPRLCPPRRCHLADGGSATQAAPPGGSFRGVVTPAEQQLVIPSYPAGVKIRN